MSFQHKGDTMKRRSFLALLGLAPAAAVGSVVPQASAAPVRTGYARIPVKMLNPAATLFYVDGKLTITADQSKIAAFDRSLAHRRAVDAADKPEA